MAKTWDFERSKQHIDKKISDVADVTIKNYGRDMSLENIPTNAAYRVDGVHMYADIVNMADILDNRDEEGVDCHRRTLRFLDLHYRAVSRLLNRVDVRRVDFHNQRLHALVTKPYNAEESAEKMRVQRAVATAQLIIDVLAQTSDSDHLLPAAKVRVGIDSGRSLAVNNGRNGYREPLFLGDPANHAAKLASNGSATGIYLSNAARMAIGLPAMDKPASTALTKTEIEACQAAAALDTTVAEIVKEWREDLKNKPIGQFEFYRQTPPFCDMDIAGLTPANSRRQEAISMYADIDGFTRYVADHIDQNTEDVIRTLHVLRAELERVVTAEFKGRRVRFIGDCVHALICEGTAAKTDEAETVAVSTLLAGGLRSSFELALKRLADHGYATGTLGLAIGFEYGPMAVTRLGIKGDRVRCAISRGVLASEGQQQRCKGTETAIGPIALARGSAAVRKLFGSHCKVAGLDYNEAATALADEGDATANAAKNAVYEHAPAILSAASKVIRPHANA